MYELYYTCKKELKENGNIQAPWIGKPEDEWEDPDEYFNAHADDGDWERENCDEDE